MSNPRKAVPSLSFNGKNVTTKLKEYLESVSYTDVASGDSDSIDISLHNIGMKWMGAWYPKKGDKISGSITFQNWNAEGKHLMQKIYQIVGMQRIWDVPLVEQLKHYLEKHTCNSICMIKQKNS